MCRVPFMCRVHGPLAAMLTLICGLASGQELAVGYHKQVVVTAKTRIDSIYPLANQSPASPPNGWLGGYESTVQRYELFLPPRYNAQRAWPVVVFISPGNQPSGFSSFHKACTSLGIIFASPYDAGNNCPGPRRVRIVLDVLDDVRRRFNTDVDRTYLGGFSGGGRIACQVAFALPEYFGGVIPVCAAGDLREESWLRRRCIDRLSVALLTGERDFNRGEVERFRGPILKDVGVRTRIWVQAGMGHSVPGDATVMQAIKWLNDGATDRSQLAKRSPTTRAAADASDNRADQARRLLADAEKLIVDKSRTYDALMLMKGITVRWPDLPQAKRATKTLLEYDAQADSRWREDDIAEQRRFLLARVRGLDSYASGPLAKQYEAQRVDMARAAINLWGQVILDGQDAKAVAEAKERLPELKKIVDGR